MIGSDQEPVDENHFGHHLFISDIDVHVIRTILEANFVELSDSLFAFQSRIVAYLKSSLFTQNIKHTVEIFGLDKIAILQNQGSGFLQWPVH
jgi:hypothetical protein